MSKLFDIFPRSFKKYYQEGTQKCVDHNCEECTYHTLKARNKACYELGLKGDFDLFRHSYDMSKPLLRRYIGPYKWENMNG